MTTITKAVKQDGAVCIESNGLGVAWESVDQLRASIEWAESILPQVSLLLLLREHAVIDPNFDDLSALVGQGYGT